jgi:hypothetical protein
MLLLARQQTAVATMPNGVLRLADAAEPFGRKKPPLPH